MRKNKTFNFLIFLMIFCFCVSSVPGLSFALTDETGKTTETEITEFENGSDYSFFQNEYDKQVEEEPAQTPQIADDSLASANSIINVTYNFLNDKKEITSSTSFIPSRDIDEEGLKVLVNAFPKQVKINTLKSKIIINDTSDITDQCGYDAETGLLLIPEKYFQSKINIEFNLNESDIVDVVVKNMIIVCDPYAQEDVRTETYTCKINSNQLRFPLPDVEYFDLNVGGDQGGIDLEGKIKVENKEIIINTSPMGGDLRTVAHADYIGRSPISVASLAGNGNELIPDGYPMQVTVSKAGTVSYGSYGSRTTGDYKIDGSIAWCAQPSSSTTPNGTYNVSGYLSAMTDENPENVANWSGYPCGAETPYIITKLLYYYGGGDGGGVGVSGQDYALTHIALGYLIEGSAGLVGTNSTGQSAAMARIDAAKAQPMPANTRFQAFLLNFGGAEQTLAGYKFLDPPSYGGTLNLKKVSANPQMTDGSNCYSLENAVFQIYKKADNSLVTTVTTDAAGNITTKLPAGEYYAIETKSPKGFAEPPKGKKIEFTITSGQTTTLEVENKPLNDPVTIFIRKQDKNGSPVNQGAASLEGAQFTVKYYNDLYKTDAELVGKIPTRTWVLQTKATARGNYMALLNDNYKISGDPFYLVNGAPVIPLGTITIQETKAPAGYLIDNTIHRYVVEQPDDKSPVITELNIPIQDEQVIKGGVKAQKFDIELNKKDAQGDGNIGVATFEIVNNSDNPVIVKDKTYEKGQVVYSAQTVDGVFQTANDLLPYGDYILREKTPPTGYLNTGEISQNFSIREDKKIVDITNTPIKNDPIRAGVFIQKWDNETNEHKAQGNATFKDTEIEIINKSAKAVIVGGVSYAPEAVVYTALLDEKGEHQTAVDLLPYGTYLVREKTAPDGYLKKGILQYQFTVREENAGKIIDPSIGEGGTADKTAIKDDPMRGDVKGIKIAKDNQRRLANVPFKITSLTTGESHILMTDENGQFSSEATWETRNQKDRVTIYGEADPAEPVALADVADPTDPVAPVDPVDPADPADPVDPADPKDPTAPVDPADPTTPIGPINDTFWFGGGTVDPTKGALLYDNYNIAEQPCEANAGYQLINFDFKIYKDSITLDLGTLEDYKPDEKVPEIGTTAVFLDSMNNDNGVKLANAVVLDTVYYYDLETDKEYTLQGTLMVKNNKAKASTNGVPLIDANGNEVTVEQKFTPTKKDGKIDMKFTFDASKLDTDEVTVFEKLSSDGVEITKHEDINDADQTVKLLPIEIGTNAHSADDKKEINVGTAIKLVDTVSYKGLAPGTEYVLRGTVMDKKTKSPLVIDGKAVEVSERFIPEASNGKIDLTFIIDTRELQGKDLVVYEELTLFGKVVGQHKNINDPDQTVKVKTIKIGTNAHRPNSDMKDIVKAEEAQIVDTVSYENLVPGTEYTLIGTLMDKATKESLDITSQITFIPDKPFGKVDMKFTFDATKLKTTEIVVYEKLNENGKEVAKHEDINDVDQTIKFVTIEIGTNAHAEGSDSKEITRADKIKVVDTVTYKNLIMGKEYVMSGVLMDKKTGEALDVKTETKFTPKAADGTIDMVFEFDSKKIDASTIVVFEELTDNGIKVAEHKDINDAQQTVNIADPPEGAKTGRNGLPFWLLIIGIGGAATAVVLYILRKKAII